MQNCMNQFETTYQQSFKMRKLEYQHHLGDFEIQIKNSKEGKPYQLVVNTVQFSILSLFNEKDNFTFEEICNRLGFESEKPLIDAFKKLCNPKIGVLNKDPKKPKFEKTDKLSVNKKYTCKQIRQNVMPAKEQAPPSVVISENQQQVLNGRKQILQAHMVKQMKAHG